MAECGMIKQPFAIIATNAVCDARGMRRIRKAHVCLQPGEGLALGWQWRGRDSYGGLLF